MFGLGFGSKAFAGGIRPALPPQPPSTPTNFQATAGDAFVTLSWDASPNADYYQVAVGTSANPTNWWDIGNVTSYEVGGLKNSTTYYMRVRAVNGAGTSAPTSDATPTPASDSGYAQIDADAGWRYPGNTLNQNNTINNRAWLGNPEQYTRATRGIYKNASNYNATYLNFTNAGQVRRIRARLRDSSTVTDAFVVFFRNEGATYNNLFAVEWYNDGYIALYSITGGSATQVRNGTVSRSASGSYLLQILDDGSVITVTVNGSQPFSPYSSTLYNTNKHIGLSLWLGTNASFDWISWDEESTVQNGNAYASLPALNVSPPQASATGAATASASHQALNVSPPQTSGSGAATASASHQALNVAVPAADATGAATASSDSVPALSISPPQAQAESAIEAYASLPALGVETPTAQAEGSANASLSLSSLSVSAPTAEASGTAQAQATLPFLALTAPQAEATILVTAEAALPALNVTPLTPQAQAGASTTTTFPAISVSPPQASATATGDAFAYGSLPAVTITPPQAQGAFYPNGYATSSFPPLWLDPPQVVAKANGNATCSIPTLNVSPPQAVAGLLVTASASFPALNVTPPQAQASGWAWAEARSPSLTLTPLLMRAVAQTDKNDKGFAPRS